MIFGWCPLAEADGAVLAHTTRLPGLVLRKGAVLNAAALAALAAAGREGVIAARLETGDVPEDAAAARLAARLVGPGIIASRAATGRVNLLAQGAGLLRVDAATINRINALDEAITFGTLPDWAVVAPGEILATVKIIPFAVAGASLARAEHAAHAAPLVLHGFAPHQVGLVLSTLPGLKESVLAGTIDATRARIDALGGTLLPPLRCAHEEAAIAAALESLVAAGADILLVAGASAVVDRRDVGPAGILRAGGEILHFGMPVDPGNLICLGRIGARPALVLPGCARSPKLNGIDWVLARLFAGLELRGSDLAAMGVGGLLKDVARPLPRARATAAKAAPALAPSAPKVIAAPKNAAPEIAAPEIAAIMLAAGQSRRMAPRNKLLIHLAPDQPPMVARCVAQVLASRAGPVVVVVGHQKAEIIAAVQGALHGNDAAGRETAGRVRFVAAADYADGLSASLRAGLAALPGTVTAALICLGDMPLVSADMLDRIIAGYAPEAGASIVVPTMQGAPGNPVLWDRRHFAAMAALRGDAGARRLLAGLASETRLVEIGDAAVLRDFDTPASLADLPGQSDAAA